jgi:hypothetical protein
MYRTPFQRLLIRVNQLDQKSLQNHLSMEKVGMKSTNIKYGGSVFYSNLIYLSLKIVRTSTFVRSPHRLLDLVFSMVVECEY